MPKISELPAAGSVSSTDEVPVRQGSVTRRAAISQLPTGGSTNVPIMTGSPFNAVTGDSSGNGGTNATAFGTSLGTNSAILTPGIYRLNSCTINGHLIVMKGAILKPNSGATVTFAAGTTVQAGDYMWLDGSAGGGFAGLNQLLCRTKGGWASGGDLGAQINNLRAWGARRFRLAHGNSPRTISTPVVCTRDMEFEGDYQGNMGDNQQLIFVQTGAGKAVFEMLATDTVPMYNVVFSNLSFFSANTSSSPSVMFWCGARVAAHGYFLRWFRVTVHGHFRLAIIYDVSCEECMVRDCNFRVFSFPGTTNCPRRGVMVHTAQHLATELSTSGGQPTPQERSHSAWSVDGGDYWVWNSTMPNCGVFVLLNNCWDFTLEPDYVVNGNGGSNGGVLVLDSAGSSNSNIYGIRIGMKGRTESNSPLIHIDWNLSYPVRGIAILYATHFAAAPVIRGETGQEKINGLYVSQSLFVHDDGTIILFDRILSITGSDVTFRRKPMRWTDSSGNDRYPSGLPANGSTDSGVLDSSFDIALRTSGGSRINGRCLAGN